ncbi:DUF421 domain-containing protein [Adhaeretor mobilis]|uniref:YetF C-terminal domain-containing protein n=1 Tax=Adhaeretor mobilis TaxID=1930276 RepID=A0A517N0R1_9BACT|nr:YetF domain-containing protein [Adhaeretor mobilis]QDT00722.1 hypothetical protein HG15A2_40620 [Adhaeretor mobilis]
MNTEWITAEWANIPLMLFTALITYATILVLTRVVGLRSFSKMSASDFAMTIAVGSLFASTIALKNPSLLIGLLAIASLYLGQWLLAWLRRKSKTFSKLVDNEPLLLMSGSTILDENLDKANVTRADLFGKLREANALNYDQILAVVFETTGDVSVLHTTTDNQTLEPDFIQNVIGSEMLT